MLIDNNLVLQSQVTKTADFESEKLAVDLTGVLNAKAVVNVTACKSTDGDETYLMYLEVYDGTTYRKVGMVEIPRGVVGKYEIPFAGQTAEKMAIGASIDGIRLNLDVNGTTPTIGYNGFITKL